MNNSRGNFSCSMYSNSHAFLAIEASLTFVFSTLALLLNTLIVTDLHKFCKSMPDTIRLMALNFSIAYVFHSCYFIYKSIYELALFISDFHLPISRQTCIADVAFYFIFLHIGHLSFFLLGFDQLCSKLWKKSLISTSSSNIILRNSFFIWLTPAVAYFAYTFYDSSNLEKLSCYCQASTAIPNTFIYQFVSYFVISVQITTCFIYAAVYHLNRKHFDDFAGGGRRDQGLSTRYNVWSNIQATKWLLPVAIFHSVLSASVIFMSIMNNALKFMSSPVDFLQFSWAVYLLFSFDRFMHPILAVRFSPSLQNGIKKLWPQKTNFLISIVRRLVLGSWKLGTDGDSNAVVFVSVEGQNVKKTGECQHVINYSISPEKQEQLLTDMWNVLAIKKKGINSKK